jgi:hypothetical protein
MPDGWVKLHRKLRESAVFTDSTKLHLWVYCLLSAAHEDYKTLIGGKEVHIQPGQFVTGRSKAAAETGLSEKQVRSGLRSLERLEMISVETKQGQAGTLVTICNWRRYQNAEEKRAKGGPSSGEENGDFVRSEGQVGAKSNMYQIGSYTDDGGSEGQVGAKQGPSSGQKGATIQEVKELKECLSARAREGELSSLDIPDDILAVARQVLGLTPEAILLDWLHTRNIPADWVREALRCVATKDPQPSNPISYANGIVAAMVRDGGPKEPAKRPKGPQSQGRPTPPAEPENPDDPDKWSRLEARTHRVHVE